MTKDGSFLPFSSPLPIMAMSGALFLAARLGFVFLMYLSRNAEDAGMLNLLDFPTIFVFFLLKYLNTPGIPDGLSDPVDPLFHSIALVVWFIIGSIVGGAIYVAARKMNHAHNEKHQEE